MTVAYNYLNLPRLIDKAGGPNQEGGTIKWTYDASGRKLQKTVENSQSSNGTVTYMDGIEKTNGIWYSVYNAEGRVSWVVFPDNPPTLPTRRSHNTNTPCGTTSATAG